MNIFVGNVNYNTDDATLRACFEEFGEVTSAKIIMDRETGRSRGFAFVEMPNDDEANTAIENLNGAEVDGKELKVNVARERERKPAFNRGGGGGRSRW